MSRRKFIAGNWKMNCTYTAADDLIKALRPLVDGYTNVDVAVCPPFTALAPVKAGLCGSIIQLGAQNFHTLPKDGKFIQSGAYTGEISAEMLRSAGVKWVILGHSERRQYFGETDASINAKVKACFQEHLLPIICVGETLQEREAGTTMKVVDTQVRGCYEGLSAEHAAQTVIAYEPVWAIGTGKTATPEQAQEVHAFIRQLLTTLYGANVAESIRIQYGGSMKANNAKELLGQKDIDGGLIGGAALVAADFAAIIKAAAE